jgi:peptide deformylase
MNVSPTAGSRGSLGRSAQVGLKAMDHPTHDQQISSDDYIKARCQHQTEARHALSGSAAE